MANQPPTAEVGLDLRLTDLRCVERVAGVSLMGLFQAATGGNVQGACGSRKARIKLTPDAARAAVARGLVAPQAFVICVNPKCATAVRDLTSMNQLLALLQ